MATRSLIVDDLDGTDTNVATISFSFQDVSYEIDLSPANLEKLAKGLAPFITKGREVVKKVPSGGANGEAAAIRIWCKQQGIEQSDKGKIGAKVREKYHAWKTAELAKREEAAKTEAPKPGEAKPAS